MRKAHCSHPCELGMPPGCSMPVSTLKTIAANLIRRLHCCFLFLRPSIHLHHQSQHRHSNLQPPSVRLRRSRLEAAATLPMTTARKTPKIPQRLRSRPQVPHLCRRQHSHFRLLPLPLPAAVLGSGFRR
jgi:hypothetical protein